VTTTKSEQANNVKILMGKQYNKTQKKQRRLKYLKRKKLAARAKRPAKPAAAS